MVARSELVCQMVTANRRNPVARARAQVTLPSPLSSHTESGSVFEGAPVQLRQPRGQRNDKLGQEPDSWRLPDK